MPLQVLVVDDILESRCALCDLVSALGHAAVDADSGSAALALLQRRRPDLVLLDLLMPDMDGFAATRRMREQTVDRWLPVIVTSSLQGEQHFIHALENGADDYLHRPVSPGLLQAKLRHYAEVLALQLRLATLAQRQRDILDNILDPVVTLDAAGRITELNQAALALTDAQGRALAPGMPCDAAFALPLAELLGRRRLTALRAAGAFPAESGLSQWQDDGRVHYTLVLRDLTEQQQVERMKDEFLATVSHELRTPLTSVLGALGLLAGGAAGALPAAARPLAEVARRNGERLGRLIDDVLDLTKIEGDRLVLHARAQPLAPLLREALAANQGYAERAGVRLVAEGVDELPQLQAKGRADGPALQAKGRENGPALQAKGREHGPALQARVDTDRFLQVMANLLSNAIKHSPAGEAVHVVLDAPPGEVRVTVRDRGPGIAPAFRARMFEKFSQAEGGDRRVQGGTGLGLHITRLLVERMGGRIVADEVTGQGAAFSVSFPVPSGAGLPPAERLRPARTVLHIDADFEARERVARWLAPLAPHCAVEGVASLAQAQAGAAQDAPALCLGNPQAQGSADAFCSALRRLAAGRPVLLYGDSVDQAFCDRVGLPWLSPARSGADELRAAVQQALAASDASETEGS